MDKQNTFNMDFASDGKDMTSSITTHIIQKIIAEEDEYTFNMIEEYVKDRKAKGECVAAKIIPEGKLRHIVNLGICVYNKCIPEKITQGELFPQEQYIEFLRQELLRKEHRIVYLENQIKIGGDNS